MAVTVLFEVPGMSAQQYDNAMRQLAERNATAPSGRLYHVASVAPDGWLVVDVWNSPEELDQFAQILMPVLQSVGVTPPQPRVFPTHNIVGS